MDNLIENVLKVYNERGLSIKQLKEITNISRKSIKWYIYNSNFIEETNPLIHGSLKTKINVYNYTPNKKKPISKRDRSKKEIQVLEVVD
jgi:hypothetical protein